jgi:phosphoglycolate phosphatase-like HAD superfamily hydrolase
VLDHLGVRHEADLVLVCPGAETQGPMAQLLVDAPLRRVRLQMMQTEPLGERLTTSIADGDSLRYYPAFRVPALDRLPPPQPAGGAAHHMQLLVSQRATGGLTIGDTHDYDEPFDFGVDEAPYGTCSTGRVAARVGRCRRWSGDGPGVYSQALRRWRSAGADQVQPDVWVVTGPGGRGMTLSPAIAEETWNGDRVTARVAREIADRPGVLDMAGTTVADDGAGRTRRSSGRSVEVGIAEDDPDMPGRLQYVQDTMGQSKIEVFRALLHDEARGAGRERFEAAIDEHVRPRRRRPVDGAAETFAALRAGGTKVCLTTGFSADTQTLIVDRLGWVDLVDLVLAPGRRCAGPALPRPGAHGRPAARHRRRAGGGGGRRHRQRPAGRGGRARGGGGVLTGAHGRAELVGRPAHPHPRFGRRVFPPLRVWWNRSTLPLVWGW